MTGKGKKLICIGAGAIGSHFVPLMVRSGFFTRFVLVDPDVYQTHNLASQDISVRDLGRPKVEVIRDHIRRIDSELKVDVIAESVERVPLGRLRGNLIATCVDNLAARRHVSRAAWRFGVPWVDAGVRTEGMLVRVDTYLPSLDSGCMECGMNNQERAELDTVYPCSPVQPTPTRSPAYLGQMAASLLGKECEQLLTDHMGHVAGGHQVLMDAANNRCIVSARRRSPDCPFDHRSWSVRPFRHSPGSVTLRRILRFLPVSESESPRLRLHGDVFVHRLLCPKCGFSRKTLRLAGRMDDDFRRCPHCGTAMVAPGIDITDTLTPDHLAGVPPRLSLYALGLRRGDVFSIETASGDIHFELGGR